MASSLSNLVDNLAKVIHKIKSKYGELINYVNWTMIYEHNDLLIDAE